MIQTYTNNPIFTMCLSRGRPDRLKETIESWKATQSGISDFFVILDEDDQHNYEHIEGINYIIQNEQYTSIMNSISKCAIESYPYIYITADDIIFRTQNWDAIFYEEAEKMNGWCVLYGNDTIQGEKLPTHPFIGAKFIKSLGYLAQPDCLHFYHDDVWKAVADGVGILKYMPQITMEHMHCNVGKAPSDETYANAHRYDDHDLIAYNNWVEHKKDNDVNKVKYDKYYRSNQ